MVSIDRGTDTGLHNVELVIHEFVIELLESSVRI